MTNEGFDHTRVAPDDPQQLRECADHFGVAEEDVREAVRAVGPEILDIEAWLSDHAKL